MTPFGRPVVPELYSQNAGSSRRGRGDTGLVRRARRTTTTRGTASTGRRQPPTTTTWRSDGAAPTIASIGRRTRPRRRPTSGSASAAMAARSSGVDIVDSGTGITPERMQPRNQAANAGSSLTTSRTRAPATTPRSVSSDCDPPRVGEDIGVGRRLSLTADGHRVAAPARDVAVEHPLGRVVQIHRALPQIACQILTYSKSAGLA